MAVYFEQSVLGASVYAGKEFICGVGSIAEAERLKKLIDCKDTRLSELEGALKELTDAIKSMDMRKQREVLYLCESLLKNS